MEEKDKTLGAGCGGAGDKWIQRLSGGICLGLEKGNAGAVLELGGICNCGGKLRWSFSVLPCLQDLKSSSQSVGIWLVEAFKTGNERCIKGLVSFAVEPAEVREYDLGLYCFSGSSHLI